MKKFWFVFFLIGDVGFSLIYFGFSLWFCSDLERERERSNGGEEKDEEIRKWIENFPYDFVVIWRERERDEMRSNGGEERDKEIWKWREKKAWKRREKKKKKKEKEEEKMRCVASACEREL